MRGKAFIVLQILVLFFIIIIIIIIVVVVVVVVIVIIIIIMYSAVGSYTSFRGHAVFILRVEDGGNWCLQNTGKQIVQCHIPEEQSLKYKNHVSCLLASPH